MKNLPTSEQLNDLDAIEEIIFIGYPNGMYDNKNLLPIVRRGITATHPNIDYLGNPFFLIDASVFPGSSGSPVVIANSGSYTSKKGLFLEDRIIFLGIVSSVYIRKEKGEIEFAKNPCAIR